jgi:hypothetical protein
LVYFKQPREIPPAFVPGRVCQISGIVIANGISGDRHLNQQIVDDLTAINSNTELVCLTMRQGFAEDTKWVSETLLD